MLKLYFFQTPNFKKSLKNGHFQNHKVKELGPIPEPTLPCLKKVKTIQGFCYCFHSAGIMAC